MWWGSGKRVEVKQPVLIHYDDEVLVSVLAYMCQ